MFKPYSAVLVCISFAFIGSFAQGQEGVSVGGATLTPAVDVEWVHQDNITRTDIDTDKISSLATIVTPSLGFSTEFGANELTLNYALGYGTYKDSSEDDYTDHTVNSALSLSFNSRNRLSLSGDYTLGHDDRGTAFSQGFGQDLAELDTHETTAFGTVYNFGAESGLAGFELSAQVRDLAYDERPTPDGLGGVFDPTLIRNRENLVFDASYSAGVGSHTALLLEASAETIEYDVVDPRGSLDSNESTYLVGAIWEGTAKTTGTIRLGYGDKTFVDSSRDDFSGPRWDASIKVMAKSYSVFTFSSEQSAEESNGVGDFSNTTVHTIDWRHQWGPRFSTLVFYTLTNEVYEGTVREDDTVGYRINLEYELGRKFYVRMGYAHERIDSNANEFNYDASVAFFGITATL